VSKLPRLSGAEVIEILVRDFGFEVVRRKGSHVVLRRFHEGKKIVTVVPLHEEIKPGTLLGILELAQISREEFLKHLKHKT
jgi:predicted RNA binding protein YcfA (HicA-like mRNA interferase family)